MSLNFHRPIFLKFFILALLAVASLSSLAAAPSPADPSSPGFHRYLYVATPGIRNYLEYGGHGIVVFDRDADFRFVKRIPTAGFDAKGLPLNVKGVSAHAETQRIYVSTLHTLIAVDLVTEKVLWEKSYEGGCDRMALSPDGQTMYLPSLEKDHWHVIRALDGSIIGKIVPRSGAHNTVYGPNGQEVYLAGLRSPFLAVARTDNHTSCRQIGPFSNSIRPFTVNGSQTLCFVNVNDLLGFEIGDLQTGKFLHRIEVQGFSKGPVKRHGCPSHGIGLTPDEKEIWLADGANSHVHIFDATVMPPKQIHSIPLCDQPGWVTFSMDGKLAFPSSGEIIEVASKAIVARLTDEEGREVGSEKVLEIHFQDGRPIRSGNQFGIGGVH